MDLLFWKSKTPNAVEGQLTERKAGRPPLDWLERGQSKAVKEQDFFLTLNARLLMIDPTQMRGTN